MNVFSILKFHSKFETIAPQKTYSYRARLTFDDIALVSRAFTNRVHIVPKRKNGDFSRETEVLEIENDFITS